MSTTVSTLTTELLDRVWDPSALGLSNAIPPTTADGTTFAYSLLTQAERTINSLEHQILTSISYSTVKNQLLYGPISQDATLSPSVIKIVGVRIGNQDLVFTPFRKLAQADDRWYSRVGQGFLTWSLFGRDLLILYPALPFNSSINVIGVELTPALTTGTQLISLSDDAVPQILDLAEALAFIKLRKPEKIQAPIQRLLIRYKSQLEGDAWLKSLDPLS